MKNILFIYKVAFLLLGSALYACNDFLEVDSKSQVTDNTLWNTPASADLFLNNVYAGLPGQMASYSPIENWTDNSMDNISWGTGRAVMAKSAQSPSLTPDYWYLFSSIRGANLFIEKVNSSSLPDDWKTQRLAEARFLRAYYYSFLWTYYGGVPLITDVLNISEQGDAVFRPRNTAEETFKFIVDECAAIANDLPIDSDAGRATRGAALTLKGWCELFWASPLHNEANERSRWETAANTNKQVMEMGVYDLFSDYNTMHFEDNNNNVEVIFDRQYLGGTSLGGSREGLQGPWMVGGTQRSWGFVGPTQELVDEYAMANGLTIDDPESGYDPQNPYENREKRFYQSIIYDGSEWLGYEMIMKQGVGSPNATDLSDANEATNTGYYLRKGLNPKYAINGTNQQNSASFIIFRFAEVLLSYAEAKNNFSGPDQSVYDAVNRVRERSELPPLKTGLTQDEMRTAIHRERRVELAFEEKRWCDLMRLRLAEETLNSPTHAMVIERQNGNWVYKVVPAPDGQRTFNPEKNYFLPISQSAIERNPQLTQNPNY